MRSDLNKQLCEHERYGSDRGFKQYRHSKKFNQDLSLDGQNSPSREPMKRRYGWNTKQFGENLNPLYGAVRKAVGRKWDAFYSELCKSFDTRSVVNRHILEHLFSFVEVKTVFVGEDGELYVRSSYAAPKAIKGSGVELYVDPRDGILKRNKFEVTYSQAAKAREAERQRELDSRKRVIDAENVLHCVNGIWFHFTLKKIPVGKVFYEKPLGVDTFKTGYAGFGKGRVEKTWDELNQEERRQFGVKKTTAGAVFDKLTEETLMSDGTRPFGIKIGQMHLRAPHGMYHATKQTASSKMLKKAGLK